MAAAGEQSLKGTAPVNTCDIRSRSEQKFCRENLSGSYLNHDHCERENVRFVAVCTLFVQYLGCSPSRSMALIFQDALHVVHSSHEVLSSSYRSTAKIRDSCVTSVIHEDVRLAMCQSGQNTKLILITYSFEITMDYVARVKKVKTLSNIG